VGREEATSFLKKAKQISYDKHRGATRQFAKEIADTNILDFDSL